jgi:hypothetical protein
MRLAILSFGLLSREARPRALLYPLFHRRHYIVKNEESAIEDVDLGP